MNTYALEKTVLTIAIIVFALLAMNEARSQDTQLTYCQNNQGEVVIVTNFTCPPGYWRI